MKAQLYPPYYTPWLQLVLTGPAPAEPLATCHNCAMVTPSGLTRDPGPFKAHLKCCTHFPFIPNFSLGDFSDESFRRLLPQALLLPAGCYPSPQVQNIRRQNRQAFGQLDSLLCPLFDKFSNDCSIWSHRPGACATYFCKSQHHSKGLSFWQLAEDFLNQFEICLAKQVAQDLGIDEQAWNLSGACLDPELDPDELPFFLDEIWQTWRGRESSFFKACQQQAAKYQGKPFESLMPESMIKNAAILNGFSF